MSRLPPFPPQFKAFHKHIKGINVIPTDANHYVDFSTFNSTVKVILYKWNANQGWWPLLVEEHCFMTIPESDACHFMLMRWLKAATRQKDRYLKSIGG